MSYRALARKYRPETFAQVVGQEHVTGTLRAALRKQKLSHAYVFSGPRGCGKTTVARLLAKALNCEKPTDGDPCGECAACVGIARGGYLDVLEIDAASNTGVDNVRELRDMAQYTPGRGGSRVFIIDEVHMLSKGAFNALLKILEEPPPRVFFFFATTEPNKIPRTILSRCQRFDFRLLSREELGARLREIAVAEEVSLADSGLRVLVSLAEGSMRDALSLLDQAIASSEDEIDEALLVTLFGLVRSDLYLELNEAIVARDPARALQLIDGLTAAGQDLDVFGQGLVMNIRNLLVVRIDPDLARSVDLPPDQIEILVRQAATFSAADLLAMLERATAHFERIHRSTQPRLMLEAAVVELARWESRVELAELVARLRGGAAATPGPAGGGSGKPAARRTAPAAPGPTTRRPDDAAAGAATFAAWTSFLDSLMQTHPRVAACLMEGLPSLDAEAGRVTIAFAAEKAFVLKNLAAEVPLLEEKLSTFLGRGVKIRLEAVADPQDQAAVVHEEIRRQIAPTDREALADDCRQDDKLGRLVDLLKGEPLPESEREKWD
jgi:DNA polymerase III subunit gamma/tau